MLATSASRSRRRARSRLAMRPGTRRARRTRTTWPTRRTSAALPTTCVEAFSSLQSVAAVAVGQPGSTNRPLTIPFSPPPSSCLTLPPASHPFVPFLLSPAAARKRQLAAAKAKEKAEDRQEDSTGYSGVGAAEAHGNKPSRGAQIDEEVRLDVALPQFARITETDPFNLSPIILLSLSSVAPSSCVSPTQLQKEDEELLKKKSS